MGLHKGYTMIKYALFLMIFCINCYGFTDVTSQGTNYLSTNVIAELADAFEERYYTFFSSGIPEPDVGLGARANIESDDGLVDSSYVEDNDIGSLIKNIRIFVGTRYYSSTQNRGFIASVPTNGFSYNDLFYSSEIEFLQSIGLSNGWRSAYSYNASSNDWQDPFDPMYASTNTERNLQVGEIMGAWVIEDAQIALDGLKYFIVEYNSSTMGWFSDGSFSTNRIQASEGDDDWEVAKSDAESNKTFFTFLNGSPRMYSEGEYTPLFLNDYRAKFDYLFNTFRMEPDAYASLTNLGGTVYFFTGATIDNTYDSYTFDDFGTGLIYSEAASGDNATNIVFDSETISSGYTNAYLYSGILGTNTVQQWCDQPDATNETTIRGFTIFNQGVILEPDYTHTR